MSDGTGSDDGDDDRGSAGSRPPFPDSLCHRCAAHRTVRGKTSTFLMCTALPQKYPRQPVLACALFTPPRA